MKIFDEKESSYFESLCNEKSLPIGQKHDSLRSDIDSRVSAPNKFSRHQHEQTRYAKEMIDVRVQAFMETCQRMRKYPDETDLREFYDDLCAIGARISTNIPRIYRSELSEAPAALLGRCDEQSTNELRQYAGIALAPVYRLVHEGQLSTVNPTADQQNEPTFHESYFVNFEKYLGKAFSSLSDLEWNKTKAFLEGLPEGIGRVDFLKELARLPDDGIVDGSIASPPLHNRNQAFLRPLHDECTRLLTQHFNLTTILHKAEQIEDHGQAISYLWNVKRDFIPALTQMCCNRYYPPDMNHSRKVICSILSILFVGLCCANVSAKRVHHYVFFGQDREKLKAASSFLQTGAFEGAQVAYSWRQLEPRKDQYDLSLIREDLAFLRLKGKKLFIQLQDVTFSESRINVPRYLLTEAQYNGGADKKYRVNNGDEEHATVEGWAARRWDPAVQERLHRLFMALGKEFDGRIEGINLAETPIGVGQTGRLFPKGFTFEIYRDAIITNMKALKRAFPKSVALQCGEWWPSFSTPN